MKGMTKEVNTLRTTIGNNLGRERSDGNVPPGNLGRKEHGKLIISLVLLMIRGEDDSHSSIPSGEFFSEVEIANQPVVPTNGISELHRGAQGPGNPGPPEEH